MPGWLDPSITRVRWREAQEAEARRQAATAQDEFERKLAQLRASHERVKQELAEINYELAWRRILRKFRPDQPRVPAGNPQGGQWTSGAASVGNAAAMDGQVLSDESPDPIGPGARYAQSGTQGRYSVDLFEEEARGGHTIDKHVNKSPEALIREVRDVFHERPFARNVHSGSFSSLDAATRLVNSTLEQNQDTVDTIARGQLAEKTVFARFDSITGIEAAATRIGSQISIRETYGVGVFLIHDRSSPRGYTVWTAFPTNLR